MSCIRDFSRSPDKKPSFIAYFLLVFKMSLSYNREVRCGIVLHWKHRLAGKNKQVKICLPMNAKLCALYHLTT